MGYFIAYRHTGVDPKYLSELLPTVRDSFNENGENVYCTFFDEEEFQNKNFGPERIMQHAFLKIEEMGGLFVVIDGPEKSEGQLIEVGYCIAKNIPIIVAKRRSVSNTYVDRMTNKVLEYENIDELSQKIKEFCKES